MMYLKITAKQTLNGVYINMFVNPKKVKQATNESTVTSYSLVFGTYEQFKTGLSPTKCCGGLPTGWQF